MAKQPNPYEAPLTFLFVSLGIGAVIGSVAFLVTVTRLWRRLE